MSEGRAALQVRGTGTRLLSQGDDRRVRNGRRGLRELASLPGTSVPTFYIFRPLNDELIERSRLSSLF